jgi:heme/copper-type cytochrome/quinol oxidase subunit 4
MTAFAFAVLVVGVVIIGSLWIIHNMTERMMPQMQHMPSLQQQP